MIEKALIDRLTPLVDGRVFFGVAPADAAQPRLVIQIIGGQAGITLAGPDGFRDATIQLDAWGATYLEALTLGEQALEAMTADGDDFTTGSADRLPDEFEDDTKLFSVRWEYTLQP